MSWNSAISLIKEPNIIHKIFIYYRYKLGYGNFMCVTPNAVYIYVHACCDHPDYWVSINEDNIHRRPAESISNVENYYVSLPEAKRLDMCQVAYNNEYKSLNEYVQDSYYFTSMSSL